MDSISIINQPLALDLHAGKGQGFTEQYSVGGTVVSPGTRGYGMGVAGDSVPYAISNDSVITLVLLGCFIFTFVSTARSLRFAKREAKRFFAFRREDATLSETSGRLKRQVVMILIGILLLSLSSYMYAADTISPSFLVRNHYVLIAMLFGSFAAYFVFCWLAAMIVNAIFFGSKKNLQWLQAKLFLTAAWSTLLLPVVLLQVYFDFTAEKVLFCFVFILILNKLLTFYKCWSIFFRQNGGLLQTFLYFCALEMAPLFAFGGIWMSMMDNLKINF